MCKRGRLYSGASSRLKARSLHLSASRVSASNCGDTQTRALLLHRAAQQSTSCQPGRTLQHCIGNTGTGSHTAVSGLTLHTHLNHCRSPYGTTLVGPESTRSKQAKQQARQCHYTKSCQPSTVEGSGSGWHPFRLPQDKGRPSLCSAEQNTHRERHKGDTPPCIPCKTAHTRCRTLRVPGDSLCQSTPLAARAAWDTTTSGAGGSHQQENRSRGAPS